MTPNRARKLAAAIAALILLTGEKGACGEDTHPSAPQIPNPPAGGNPPAQPPQAPPNPAAGDPGPHLQELRNQVKDHPEFAVLLVTWAKERKFWLEPTTERGQVAHREYQRAQTATGGWWAKVISVRPGQQIGISAGPDDAVRQRNGAAVCEILHATGPDLQAALQTVAAGPCAASYTIPG